jgi:hypothetical protein
MRVCSRDEGGSQIDVGIDPELALLAAVTTAIGWTMLFAGTRKRMLDLRHQKRICPSCGHEIEGRVCNRH